jgi:hypothetical protein
VESFKYLVSKTATNGKVQDEIRENKKGRLLLKWGMTRKNMPI